MGHLSISHSLILILNEKGGEGQHEYRGTALGHAEENGKRPKGNAKAMARPSTHTRHCLTCDLAVGPQSLATEAHFRHCDQTDIWMSRHATHSPRTGRAERSRLRHRVCSGLRGDVRLSTKFLRPRGYRRRARSLLSDGGRMSWLGGKRCGPAWVLRPPAVSCDARCFADPFGARRPEGSVDIFVVTFRLHATHTRKHRQGALRTGEGRKDQGRDTDRDRDRKELQLHQNKERPAEQGRKDGWALIWGALGEPVFASLWCLREGR